jgi:hypothetical protein
MLYKNGRQTYRWLSIVFAAVIVFSCSKSLPELEGIDIENWKKDSNGCNGKRIAMKEAIQKEKEKLLALNELEVIQVLGRPDRNELFKRNQKFYYYFLDASDRCAVHLNSPEKLIVRFNAMGLAKEITIE